MAAPLFFMTVLQLGALSISLGILYVFHRVIYNLYFHPLSKFPGPKIAAISNIWYAKHWTGGRWPYILEDLHKKYGGVVRYAPNDLDFATPQSYQDIYGHAKQGKKTFLKGDSYNLGPEADSGIVSQRDPAKHRETRKSLSHAFSAKALRLQADVVLHYVNLWIQQIARLGNTDEGINVEEWYNWLTFDIIGDLAFGESFGAVENAESHPWVHTLKKSIFAGVFVDVFRRVPLLKVFPLLLRPSGLMEHRKEMFRLSMEKAKARIQKGNDRDDFFGHLLSEKAPDITLPYLTIQANTFIVAGSETTATFLTGVTYYLLKTPSTIHNLTQEIRTTFSDSSMITGDSTENLPYLFAVIEEGLRIFPPVPAGLQRVSPGSFVDGHYVPTGTSVSSSGWSTTHNDRYFFHAREFCPERWLPKDHKLYDQQFKNDVKEASRPFLLGPRACLGINLAYMEMRVILARLMWKFDLELVNKEVNWERDTMLRTLWQSPELRVRFRAVST